MDETVDDILDDALAYVHESRADLVRDELNRLRDLQAGVSEAVRLLPERMRQDARREGVTFEQRNAIDAWRLELEKALAAHGNEGCADSGGHDGYVLVPKEPTEAMLDATVLASDHPSVVNRRRDHAELYRTMIAAARSEQEGDE